MFMSLIPLLAVVYTGAMEVTLSGRQCVKQRTSAGQVDVSWLTCCSHPALHPKLMCNYYYVSVWYQVSESARSAGRQAKLPASPHTFVRQSLPSGQPQNKIKDKCIIAIDKSIIVVLDNNCELGFFCALLSTFLLLLRILEWWQKQVGKTAQSIKNDINDRIQLLGIIGKVNYHNLKKKMIHISLLMPMIIIFITAYLSPPS